jgi:DNA-binding transcriptional LysR family regulator
MLNLHELAVFLAAAEHGNFSEAGRQLHLSQPAISQTMDNLEKRFGMKLFMRQGRRFCLTEAGQVLRPIAQELLSAAQRLDETMASLHGEVTGEINVGCSTVTGKYLLPGLIARFRSQFPKVRVNVHLSSREAALDELLQGQISIGVFSKLYEHRDLMYKDFYMDNVILIAPADHSWAYSRSIKPEDLLDEPILIQETAAGTREVFLEGLHQCNISPDMLTIAMILGNTEAIVMAVEEGLGVAFVSRLAAARSLESGRVAEINIEGIQLCRNIYLLRNRRIPSTRAQDAFWDFGNIAETVKENSWLKHP